MVKVFNRQQHLAREIQKKIAIILQHKVRDPRINKMITVSEIKISKDLTHAKVYVTFLNNKNENDNIVVLQKASSYIRNLLGKVMHLRVIPELRFLYDDSLVKGIKICKLVDLLIKKYKKNII